MNLDPNAKYQETHEWARPEGDLYVCGITDYAQDKLGDVVYVELPQEGDDVQKDEPFGSVESVKAVSDLFSPLSGTVLEINDALLDSPEAVNEDPYGEAWMLRVRPADFSELDGLMKAEEYQQFLAAEEESES